MNKKKVIVSVTNDLVSDQRVHKVSVSLLAMNYQVLLVGRKYSSSVEMAPRAYEVKRLRMIFRKGPFFYAEYQIRLFVFLLSHRSDLLVSNDLDTLLPNFLVSKIYRSKLFYDSHEYFTGVPELQGRPLIRKIWKTIEKLIVPGLDKMYTVNQSIADLYANEYGIRPYVVRNVPLYIQPPIADRKALGLPENKKIILLQGAGINVDRGAEEAVMAMQYIENTLLLIIGEGDVLPKLKNMVENLYLNDKVKFIDKLPFSELMKYTVCADLGLTLDKPGSVNYDLSLPNKLFDYIHAGIPILASPLKEIKNIIQSYNIGAFIENHEPLHIAQKIQDIFNNSQEYETWKLNTKRAAEELCWQKEEVTLNKIFFN